MDIENKVENEMVFTSRLMMPQREWAVEQGMQKGQNSHSEPAPLRIERYKKENLN